MEAKNPFTTIPVTIISVQSLVAERFGVSVEEIKGKSRFKEIMVPRQVGYMLARQYSMATYPKIGKYFGGRDHTTILSGIDRIQRLIDQDVDLAEDVNFVIKRLTRYARN